MYSPRQATQYTSSLDSWKWRFLLPGSPFLTQFVVGALNVQRGDYYTLEISNAPLVPPSVFGTHLLRGNTQPGWTVEMHEGGRLKEVTQADSLGRYSFEVPFSYVGAERTIVQVGPHREQIRERHRLILPQSMNQPGKIQYDARLVTQQVDSLTFVGGSGRLSAGISSWLTAGVEGSLVPVDMERLAIDSIKPSAFANLWIGEATSLSPRWPRWRRAAACRR